MLHVLYFEQLAEGESVPHLIDSQLSSKLRPDNYQMITGSYVLLKIM